MWSLQTRSFMSKEIEINDLHFFFQRLLQWPLLKTTQGREKLSGRTKTVFPGKKNSKLFKFDPFWSILIWNYLIWIMFMQGQLFLVYATALLKDERNFRQNKNVFFQINRNPKFDPFWSISIWNDPIWSKKNDLAHATTQSREKLSRRTKWFSQHTT